MKNISLALIVIVLIFGGIQSVSAKKKTIEKQLFNNFNIGYDVNISDQFYGTNFHIGTGISEKFKSDPQAYWLIGADVNWNKYVLYETSFDSDFERYSVLRTNSLSFPFLVGYKVRKSFFTGLNVYGGPVYELIFNSSIDRAPYYDLKPAQLGLVLGAKVRFFVFLNARISYKFYPGGIFYNGDLNRSALSFSVGL